MRRKVIFTSESVTPGHPDKLCDQISDAAVDAFLRQDPEACVTVECAMATGVVFIASRSAAHAAVDLSALARSVITDAGYTGGARRTRAPPTWRGRQWASTGRSARVRIRKR